MNYLKKLQQAYHKLQQAKKVLIISHTSPDADALSSLGAILEISHDLGLETYAYADQKVSSPHSFIPHEELITNEPPVNLLDFDLIFILDCGSLSRTGLEARIRTMLKATQEGRTLQRPYLIEFDHHQAQETYADLEIRLADKASTTEIIYYFLKTNNLAITKSLANCILIGLLSDTGHFLHANSSQKAIAISSEMLLRGASLPKIVNYTIRNKSFSALKVWGQALENMQFNAQTGLISSALQAEELKKLLPSGEEVLNPDLFGEIVSFLSTLEGVKVALFLREEGQRVKGSLRSTSKKYDVAKIAQNWGGGGHQQAAGFSLPGHLVRIKNGWKIVKT